MFETFLKAGDILYTLLSPKIWTILDSRFSPLWDQNQIIKTASHSKVLPLTSWKFKLKTSKPL